MSTTTPKTATDDVTTKTTESVTVSAPGKMLLAGGYLVLEQENVGLVIAVNKRFYCRCVRKRRCSKTVKTTKRRSIIIVVSSPQFDNKTWKYEWDYNTRQLVQQVVSDDNNTTSTSKNPFVEKTLKVILLYLSSSSTLSTTTMYDDDIHITIIADNDFYSLLPHLESRNWSKTIQNAQQLPKFLPAAKDLNTDTIYKTGLGSSACLVTSIVGSMLILSSSSSTSSQSSSSTSSSIDPSIQHVIYQLSQIAHCFAQGKIGSGFDVSAACYGSHVYRRFPKTQLLEDLLEALDNDNDTQKEELSKKLHAVLNDTDCWTTNNSGVVQSVHCFNGRSSSSSTSSSSLLQVIMADVRGGSESPSMAKKVLQWKQKQQQQQSEGSCIPHWDDLQTINAQIVSCLQEIHTSTITLSCEEMEQLKNDLLSNWCSSSSHPQNNLLTTSSQSQHSNKVGKLLSQLRTNFIQARYHLKQMGNAVGQVPIEPDEQTELCDACQKLSGVIACVVPGAGGYDAISCLYINTGHIQRSIADFWKDYKPVSVCPLTVQGADYGDGVRIEPEFPTVATTTSALEASK